MLRRRAQADGDGLAPVKRPRPAHPVVCAPKAHRRRQGRSVVMTEVRRCRVAGWLQRPVQRQGCARPPEFAASKASSAGKAQKASTDRPARSVAVIAASLCRMFSVVLLNGGHMALQLCVQRHALLAEDQFVEILPMSGFNLDAGADIGSDKSIVEHGYSRQMLAPCAVLVDELSAANSQDDMGPVSGAQPVSVLYQRRIVVASATSRSTKGSFCRAHSQHTSTPAA